MMKIKIDNNKKETINQIKSQCYSSSNKNNIYIPTLATILEDSATIDTVADSAATGHFFPNEDNEKNSHNNIEVVCANNQTMISQATTALDIPELSTKAKTAYIFNEMKQPLLSIPLLADDGCTINLTEDNIVVVKDNKIIKRKKRQGDHTLDDPNQASQKETATSTRPTSSTISTCSQQCISSTNNSKVNGISQCNNRIITS
jgi:hypothetical protein